MTKRRENVRVSILFVCEEARSFLSTHEYQRAEAEINDC